MTLNLSKMVVTEHIDYNYLKYMLRDYKHPRVKINDLLKKGQIIRVKKGLYVLGPELARGPYSKEVLANLIYGPSYVSLEYALSFYSLIPERVETVTSVTNKRKKIFTTPVGVFSYRYIKNSIYPDFIRNLSLDKYNYFLIATKEKALCDFLYFFDKISNKSQLAAHLFEELRIDQNELYNFDLSRVKKLSELYGQNVNLLYNLLRNAN